MNFEILSKTKLFDGLSTNEIFEIFKKVSFFERNYQKGEIIFEEGEELVFIGIVLEGKVDVVHISFSGKEYVINTLGPGETFGEAVVFSSKNYLPATIVSKDKTKILLLQKNDIIKLTQSSERILRNYLRILSDRLLMANKRLKEATLMTLRQKICNYLLEEAKRQKSLKIVLPISKENLAEFLGVQRPSLSRELFKMEEEGMIIVDGKTIKIVDIERIENEVY